MPNVATSAAPRIPIYEVRRGDEVLSRSTSRDHARGFVKSYNRFERLTRAPQLLRVVKRVAVLLPEGGGR